MASTGCSAVQPAASRIPVPIRKKTKTNAKSTQESHTSRSQLKDNPAGRPVPTTSVSAAPRWQRSTASSTVNGEDGSAILCEPTRQREKETGLPCEAATASKVQSVGRRTAEQGGLFRKARGICRTFNKPASTQGTNTAVRKTPTPHHPITTSSWREKARQADKVESTPSRAKLTTAIPEAAAPPPPVGGAAPCQSTLSQDIAELEEIVKKLSTTRTRTRPQASHGVMTGTYSPGHGGKRGDREELKELVKLMATTSRRRKAGRVGQTPGKTTTGTGLGVCSGVATSDQSEVEALMKSYLVSCQRRRNDRAQSTVRRVVPLSLKAPVSACKSSVRRRTRQNYFKFPELQFTPSHHTSPLRDVGNGGNLLSPSVDVAYSPFVADMFQRQQKAGGEVGNRKPVAPSKDPISLFWEDQKQNNQCLAQRPERVNTQPQSAGAQPQASTDYTHPLHTANGMLSSSLHPSDSCDDMSSPPYSTGEGGRQPVGPLVYED